MIDEPRMDSELAERVIEQAPDGGATSTVRATP
jgi:hypothetical protein